MNGTARLSAVLPRLKSRVERANDGERVSLLVLHIHVSLTLDQERASLHVTGFNRLMQSSESTEKKTRVTTSKTKPQSRLRLHKHVCEAGVAPFVRFVSACGVRNHVVANAFDVTVFGPRGDNIMLASDASRGASYKSTSGERQRREGRAS